MCRVAQQQFPDQPIAAAQARGFVGATLQRWSLESLVPDVQLAVTELSIVNRLMLHVSMPCERLEVHVCSARTSRRRDTEAQARRTTVW